MMIQQGGGENPSCDRGCLDRDRYPAFGTRCCAPIVTYIQYEGCDIIAILGRISEEQFILAVGSGTWSTCW